jgi:Pyruvate/2-oxoacid:ferredoxin oxidoreductase delta subunit
MNTFQNQNNNYSNQQKQENLESTNNHFDEQKTDDTLVPNTDNHYERQYSCKSCQFFTNNPRAVLYHRIEFHNEKINVHECNFCQYASQYSGKVERHTLLRHKIQANSKTFKTIN